MYDWKGLFKCSLKHWLWRVKSYRLEIIFLSEFWRPFPMPFSLTCCVHAFDWVSNSVERCAEVTFRPASVVPAVPWWTAGYLSISVASSSFWWRLGSHPAAQYGGRGGGKGFNVSLSELLINVLFQNQPPMQLDEAASTQLGSSCSEIFHSIPLTFSESQIPLLLFLHVISCLVSSGTMPLLLF